MGRILTISFAASLALGLAAPAMAGNPQAGGAVFRAQCGVCHAATEKAPPGVGPRLFGVVGRKAGTLPGFSYSPAMKGSGLTWKEATLKTYLASPAQVVPGNRMPYPGLKNPAQLDDLVAYLATLK